MKYIVKQKVLWLVILMLLLSINTLEPVHASGIGAYSVYDIEKNTERPISIINGKLSYGEDCQCAINEKSSRQIIGDNNMIKIEDTTIYEYYRARTHLKVTFPNGKVTVSSGTMIGPCTLITAAHCVYNEEFGGFATSIVAAPGRNGNVYPYGTTTSKEISIPTAYKNSAIAANDIAVVNLKTLIGVKSGHLICKYLPDSTLLNPYTGYEILGYPGSGYTTWDGVTTNGELWGMGTRILDVSGKTLKHEGDTYPGHSGSGLVYMGEYVIAIHNRYPKTDNSYNFAARIDSEYMKWITTMIEKVSAG